MKKMLNKKNKVYVYFQLLSSISIILIVVSLFIYSNNSPNLYANESYSTTFKNMISFKQIMPSGIIGSICIYTSFICYFLSMFLGISIKNFKNRNIYDTLFLMFLIFPILNNFLAFFSQLAKHAIRFTPQKLEYSEIKKEKLRIINLVKNIDTIEDLKKLKLKEKNKTKNDIKKERGY